MSFLLDPFLLIAFGAVTVWLYNRLLYRLTRHAKKTLAAITLLIFWVVSVSLYLNLGWFDWIWQWTGWAINSRDFMINSGLFHLEYVNTVGLIDAIAIFLFILYPLWLYCGIFIGYILFGRHERQTGIIGLL